MPCQRHGRIRRCRQGARLRPVPVAPARRARRVGTVHIGQQHGCARLQLHGAAGRPCSWRHRVRGGRAPDDARIHNGHRGGRRLPCPAGPRGSGLAGRQGSACSRHAAGRGAVRIVAPAERDVPGVLPHSDYSRIRQARRRTGAAPDSIARVRRGEPHGRLCVGERHAAARVRVYSAAGRQRRRPGLCEDDGPCRRIPGRPNSRCGLGAGRGRGPVPARAGRGGIARPHAWHRDRRVDGGVPAQRHLAQRRRRVRARPPRRHRSPVRRPRRRRGCAAPGAGNRPSAGRNVP